MYTENRKQIEVLASLSDDMLITTVIELGKLLRFDPPKYQPGMDKTKYATRVIECMEVSNAKLSIPECQQRAVEIQKRCENEIPTLWNQVINSLKKLYGPFNLKIRKN